MRLSFYNNNVKKKTVIINIDKNSLTHNHCKQYLSTKKKIIVKYDIM